MEQINIFIDMLEEAGIKYEVDQTVNDDGQRSLDVYVYDADDHLAVFAFDANTPDLIDFKVI